MKRAISAALVVLATLLGPVAAFGQTSEQPNSTNGTPESAGPAGTLSPSGAAGIREAQLLSYSTLVIVATAAVVLEGIYYLATQDGSSTSSTSTTN